MVHFDISNNLIHMYAFFDAVNLFGDPPGIHVALVASINTLHLINREFSLEPLAGLFISELLQITNIKCFLIHVQTLTGCFTSCSFCRNVATGIVPMSLGCKMHNTGDEFICMCIILVVKKKKNLKSIRLGRDRKENTESAQCILINSYKVNINLFRPVKINSLTQHKL